MKEKLKRITGESWRTSLLGYGLIALGLWAFYRNWVNKDTLLQALQFNLLYTETASIAIIAVGFVAIMTREQRVHDKSKEGE